MPPDQEPHGDYAWLDENDPVWPRENGTLPTRCSTLFSLLPPSIGQLSTNKQNITMGEIVIASVYPAPDKFWPIRSVGLHGNSLLDNSGLEALLFVQWMSRSAAWRTQNTRKQAQNKRPGSWLLGQWATVSTFTCFTPCDRKSDYDDRWTRQWNPPSPSGTNMDGQPFFCLFEQDRLGLL